MDDVDIGLPVGEEVVGARDTGEAGFGVGNILGAGTGAAVVGCGDGERVGLDTGATVPPSSIQAPPAHVPNGTELQGLESGKY